MPSDDLAKLRGVLEGMSPGPWSATTDPYEGEIVSEVTDEYGRLPVVSNLMTAKGDVSGIVTLRNIAPLLLEVIEAGDALGHAMFCPDSTLATVLRLYDIPRARLREAIGKLGA